MDEQTEFNPRRRLCPDGTCTGIIGPDGRCGECGRPAGANDAPADLWSATLGDLMPDEEPAPGAPLAAGGAPMPIDSGPELSAAAGGGFDPRRRLCDDGACVGVIGPSGACGVCGRRAAS